MIELTEQGGVAVLRLGHGKVNAMSLEFCEALTARFAAVSSARAVVLTGTGHIFSAGVDLLRLTEGGAPYVRKFLPALRTMLATVFSHPAPVVAAINGHALAGGPPIGRLLQDLFIVAHCSPRFAPGRRRFQAAPARPAQCVHQLLQAFEIVDRAELVDERQHRLVAL